METPFQILLIEDDPAVARSLQEGLKRDGFQVAWKASGREGIEFARQNPPHLMILDVRLPDGSGFDVCRRVRQLGMRQPVIMLTVQREEMDKVLGLAIVRAVAKSQRGRVEAENLPDGGARFTLSIPAV